MTLTPPATDRLAAWLHANPFPVLTEPARAVWRHPIAAALDLHDVLPTMPTSGPAEPAPAPPALCDLHAWSLARCADKTPDEPAETLARRRADLARQCPDCCTLNQGA